eukprot:3937006-Rhodomonas_salina.1
MSHSQWLGTIPTCPRSVRAAASRKAEDEGLSLVAGIRSGTAHHGSSCSHRRPGAAGGYTQAFQQLLH